MENGKIKIVTSFSVIRLCFVINVLNNNTVILLTRLAEYPQILANSAYGLVDKCHAIFRVISQDNCELVAGEMNMQVRIKFPRKNFKNDGSETEQF